MPKPVPKLDGVLETAIYTDDMSRARSFYEGVLGLTPIFSDARLTAYGIAPRSVLLIFRRGAATQTVTIPGGTIPGTRRRGAAARRIRHRQGRTRTVGAASGGERRRCRRRNQLVARRPQHLFPRSGRAPAGAGDAGIVVCLLRDVRWAKARTSAFTRVFDALWLGPRLPARDDDVGTPLRGFAHPTLSMRARYLTGICTLRPAASGFGSCPCEAFICSSRRTTSGGNGATFFAVMSTCSDMFSEVADTQPSSA